MPFLSDSRPTKKRRIQSTSPEVTRRRVSSVVRRTVDEEDSPQERQRLEKEQWQNQNRFRHRMEDIFERYSADLGADTDEINIRTGAIEVDRGHLRALPDALEEDEYDSFTSDEDGILDDHDEDILDFLQGPKQAVPTWLEEPNSGTLESANKKRWQPESDRKPLTGLTMDEVPSEETILRQFGSAGPAILQVLKEQATEKQATPTPTARVDLEIAGTMDDAEDDDLTLLSSATPRTPFDTKVSRLIQAHESTPTKSASKAVAPMKSKSIISSPRFRSTPEVLPTVTPPQCSIHEMTPKTVETSSRLVLPFTSGPPLASSPPSTTSLLTDSILANKLKSPAWTTGTLSDLPLLSIGKLPKLPPLTMMELPSLPPSTTVATATFQSTHLRTTFETLPLSTPRTQSTMEFYVTKCAKSLSILAPPPTTSNNTPPSTRRQVCRLKSDLADDLANSEKYLQRHITKSRSASEPLAVDEIASPLIAQPGEIRRGKAANRTRKLKGHTKNASKVNKDHEFVKDATIPSMAIQPSPLARKFARPVPGADKNGIPKLKSIESPSGLEGRPYICPYAGCVKTFRSRFGYDWHRDNGTCEFEESKLVCHSCGEAFKESTSLRYHLAGSCSGRPIPMSAQNQDSVDKLNSYAKSANHSDHPFESCRADSKKLSGRRIVSRSIPLTDEESSAWLTPEPFNQQELRLTKPVAASPRMLRARAPKTGLCVKPSFRANAVVKHNDEDSEPNQPRRRRHLVKASDLGVFDTADLLDDLAMDAQPSQMNSRLSVC